MNLDKSHITKIALQMLELRKVKCWRQNNVRAVKGRSFVGLKGVPDIIGFHTKTSVMCAVEVKTVTDKLSVDQIDFLTDLRNAGGIALIATENKLGQVELVEFSDYLIKQVLKK